MRRCLAFFRVSLGITSELPLLLADLSFVNRLIQMFNGLDAMAVEIMLRGLQMMLGIPHRFQRLSDVGMGLWRGCRRGVAGIAAAAGTGAAGALGPAADAVKASANRSVARISRVNNPIFFKCSSSSEFRLGRNRCNFDCNNN